MNDEVEKVKGLNITSNISANITSYISENITSNTSANNTSMSSKIRFTNNITSSDYNDYNINNDVDNSTLVDSNEKASYY